MAAIGSLVTRCFTSSYRHISRQRLPVNGLQYLVSFDCGCSNRSRIERQQWSGGYTLAQVPRSYSSSAAGNSGNSSEWAESVRGMWMGIQENSRKLMNDVVSPYTNELFNSHPYLKDVAGPAGYTLLATGLVWFVMPRIFKRLHGYAMKSRVRELLGNVHVPYEKSFWGALEDPVRYLVSFFAFTQVGMLTAPSIVSPYLQQAWRGAAIFSLIWFLYRCKTNWISIALSSPNLVAADKTRIMTLDSISSIGLFIVGLMSFAEASGVAVHSILTLGGIGGVATAFAAKDILGNILSGFSIKFTLPFAVGDTIKAGSIEGKVIKMGLTSTQLLTTERFPVTVPNSLFSSQAIVNKSRAEWRAITANLPISIESLEFVPKISADIKTMLSGYQDNMVLKEPFCYLSGIDNGCAELTLGYNLKHAGKEKQYAIQQEILLQSVDIVKNYGCLLCTSMQSSKGS